jgi:hypothetical protein
LTVLEAVAIAIRAFARAHDEVPSHVVALAIGRSVDSGRPACYVSVESVGAALVAEGRLSARVHDGGWLWRMPEGAGL